MVNYTLFPCTQSSARTRATRNDANSYSLPTAPLPASIRSQPPPTAPNRHARPFSQVVDLGELGPIRCGRCKAYVNAYCRWLDGGKAFGCNFCGATTPCPEPYFWCGGPCLLGSQI
jgi:protein transport protein SEC24